MRQLTMLLLIAALSFVGTAGQQPVPEGILVQPLQTLWPSSWAWRKPRTPQATGFAWRSPSIKTRMSISIISPPTDG
jgi:hypothetical protein